jgi:hypothetical protein
MALATVPLFRFLLSFLYRSTRDARPPPEGVPLGASNDLRLPAATAWWRRALPLRLLMVVGLASPCPKGLRRTPEPQARPRVRR